MKAMFSRSLSALAALGLTPRPARESLREAVEWMRERGEMAVKGKKLNLSASSRVI